MSTTVEIYADGIVTVETVEPQPTEVEVEIQGPQGIPAPTTIAANTQVASYTFVLDDGGKVVEISSAVAVNATIPDSATVNFPIGTVIEVFQYGAGQITIVAGAGVTLRSPAGLVKTSIQYASISLRKRAADEWVLAGDLI